MSPWPVVERAKMSGGGGDYLSMSARVSRHAGPGLRDDLVLACWVYPACSLAVVRAGVPVWGVVCSRWYAMARESISCRVQHVACSVMGVACSKIVSWVQRVACSR